MEHRQLLLPSLVLLFFGVWLLVEVVEGSPELASNHSLKNFNFQNAHFNARNLWLTFNVLMNGDQLTNDVDTQHVLCVANLTFAITCRPLAEGCHSNEIQTPTNGVFATLDLCLNANRTIAVINLLANYDEALAAIWEQGFVFKSTLTQMEYEQVLVMLANEGIQKAWLGLKLFVSTRRRRDTEPMFVDLLGNMVNSSTIQWAANEPNTTVGNCLIVASSGVAMHSCDEPVDGAVADQFHMGEVLPTTIQPTVAGTTVPPILYCTIPTHYSNVIRFNGSDGQPYFANDSIAVNQSIVITCDRQCDVPIQLICQGDGNWSPSPPAEGDVCRDPDVLRSGLLCATLYFLNNYLDKNRNIYSGQRACANVESYFNENGMNNMAWSISVRENCHFTAYDNADRSGASLFLTSSLPTLGSFNDMASTASCLCPPNYCLLDEDNPNFRYVVDGRDPWATPYLQFGGAYPPGTNVTIQCQGCKVVPTIFVCQSDGTWSPSLPASNVNPCIDLPVATAPPTCAQVFEGLHFFESTVTMSQEQCFDLAAAGLDNAVSSVRVRQNCVMIGHDFNPNFGPSQTITNDTTDLDAWNNLFTVASCSCPPSPPNCLIEPHPNLRYKYGNSDIILGGVIFPGENVTIGCPMACDDPGALSTAVYTCQEGGTWSPPLPDASVNTCTSPGNVTSAPLCARFYSEADYVGHTIGIYQETCSNLVVLDNIATSVRVSINCQLTAYDFNPTYGESFEISSSMPQLPSEWDKRISSAVCSCPPSPPNCIVDEHPNIIYSYQGDDIPVGAVLPPGSVIKLRCRFLCGQDALPYSASQCRSDGTWSNPLPTSNSDICKPSDIATSGLVCAVAYQYDYYIGTNLTVFDGQQACTDVESFLVANSFNNAITSIHVRRNCLFTGYDWNRPDSRSLQLTESAQLDSYWKNRISRYSCECPSSPPNCLVDDNHPTLRFVYGDSVIVFGGVIPPGGNVTLQCRLPCSNISTLATFVSTCQTDGTWLPELPGPSDYTDFCTDVEPPVLTGTVVCATVFAASSLSAVPLYDGQKACANVQAVLNDANDAVTSIQLRKNCVFTGYDLPDASGLSVKLNESVNVLTPTFANMISTASCFCPASSCFLDDYHPTLRFAAVDDGITVGAAGAAFLPGTNITVRCKARCASLDDIAGLTFTCQPDGSWSPSLPSTTTYTDKCLVEPAPPTSGTVCAKLFSGDHYEGAILSVFDGIMACANVEPYLASGSMSGEMNSVHVRHGCTLTAYDMADASDASPLVLTTSTAKLDYFWIDRISSLSCTCPDVASRCVIEAHPVFRYVIDGVVAEWGASVAVGSNITLTCRSHCNLIGEWSTFTSICQAGGILSVPLPASNVIACTDSLTPVTSGPVCAVLNYLSYFTSSRIATIYHGQQPCGLTSLSKSAWSVQVTPGCVFVGYESTDLTSPSFQLTQSEPLLIAYRPAPFYITWDDRIDAASCQCHNCYVPASPLIGSIMFANSPLVAGDYAFQGSSNATVQCNGLCATSGPTTCPLKGNGDWNPNPLAICQEPAVLQSGQTCARLFEQFDYAGSQVDFYAGQQPCMNVQWDLLGSLNDNTTSVQVRYGCTLTVYENADGSGASRNFTSSSANLTDFNWLISTASCDCPAPTGTFCEVASNTTVPLKDSEESTLFLGGVFAAGEIVTYQCQSSAIVQFTCTVGGWAPALPNESNPEAACNGT